MDMEFEWFVPFDVHNIYHIQFRSFGYGLGVMEGVKGDGGG